MPDPLGRLFENAQFGRVNQIVGGIDRQKRRFDRLEASSGRVSPELKWKFLIMKSCSVGCGTCAAAAA